MLIKISFSLKPGDAGTIHGLLIQQYIKQTTTSFLIDRHKESVRDIMWPGARLGAVEKKRCLNDEGEAKSIDSESGRPSNMFLPASCGALSRWK